MLARCRSTVARFCPHPGRPQHGLAPAGLPLRRRREAAMSGHRELGWPEYVVAAAAEAREESKRYWATGGWADKRYPKHPPPWWPLSGDDAAADEQAARRQPRQWKRP